MLCDLPDGHSDGYLVLFRREQQNQILVETRALSFYTAKTLNGNRASPDRIHKIPLNVVCDKVRGLLPKSRGPFATWGQAEEPGVAFEGCAEDSVVQR